MIVASQARAYDMNTLTMTILMGAIFSVGFMLWFLSGLVVDEMKSRRKRASMRFAGSVYRERGTAGGYRPVSFGKDDERGYIRPTPADNSSEEAFAPVLKLRRQAGVQAPVATTKKAYRRLHWFGVLLLVSTLRISAQNSGSTQTNPAGASQTSAATPLAPLTTPAITGPLQAAPPIEFDAGPLGKLDVDGIVSGMGLWQGNHVAGDDNGQAALSNGQVWLQKPTGWFQFYVQGGAYNILALGTPFLPTDKAVSDLYGAVPVAFVKLVPAKNTSIFVGALPTLMGAEYTFDFENMNIERGLLWNQENAVNRGIQLTQTMGKFAASISWNDGYYSNRYSWVSGSLTYAKGPHSLSFVGMGNLGQTSRQTLATPVQNNGSMYALIYTYTKGAWIVQPYYQYSDVPTNPTVGVLHGATTNGGALLLSRTFKHGFSLAGRGEYISSSGSVAVSSVNLMYGPGSSAWSATLTPTFQQGRFFARGDLSLVRANNITPGGAFGSSGTNRNQPRAVIEIGFLF